MVSMAIWLRQSSRSFARLVADHGLHRTSPAPLAAGDATFHGGWTLHGAPANRSGAMREVMTVIYDADGTRIGPLDHRSRRLDCALWARQRRAR
jgi:ectoine hydroxylase-related dioxygenase (phytanoyl-CoA dioxygenase family)